MERMNASAELLKELRIDRKSPPPASGGGSNGGSRRWLWIAIIVVVLLIAAAVASGFVSIGTARLLPAFSLIASALRN